MGADRLSQAFCLGYDVAALQAARENIRRQPGERLREFYEQVCRLVFKWLNRRSQRRGYSWVRFKAMLARYAIPKPRIVEPAAKRRFAFC